MLSKVKTSLNKQHLLVYACLLIFLFCLRLFSHNAFDLGWGFFPLVISLPFVPFILVWLAVQFYRNFRSLNAPVNLNWPLCHCVCTASLFSLFVLNFIG